MSADYNAVRFDPVAAAACGHVESYFLKLNDAEGRRALWLKGTILARLGADPVAECWAIAFDREGEHVGVKEVVPYREASFSPRGFDVQVKNIRLCTGSAAGSIEQGGRLIEWDLDFTTDSDPLVPFFHPMMYEGPLPSSKLVTPHPSSRFSGSYRVDGREVEVDGWHGMQGHNWGKQHAELYGWVHCNRWLGGEDSVLEVVCARIKLGPLLVPPLTVVCLWHGGVRYELIQPLDLLRARGRISLRSLHFSAYNRLARIEGELSARTKDFVGLHYENPTGEMTYCLNSKIAEGQLKLEMQGKPEVVLRTNAAALEIGTKDPTHGVRMVA